MLYILGISPKFWFAKIQKYFSFGHLFEQVAGVAQLCAHTASTVASATISAPLRTPYLSGFALGSFAPSLTPLSLSLALTAMVEPSSLCHLHMVTMEPAMHCFAQRVKRSLLIALIIVDPFLDSLHRCTPRHEARPRRRTMP